MENITQKIESLYEEIRGIASLEDALKNKKTVLKLKKGFYMAFGEEDQSAYKSHITSKVYANAEVYQCGRRVIRDVELIENGDVILKYWDTNALVRRDGHHILSTHSISYEGNNSYSAQSSDYHGRDKQKEAHICHTDLGTCFKEYSRITGETRLAFCKMIPWENSEEAACGGKTK